MTTDLRHSDGAPLDLMKLRLAESLEIDRGYSLMATETGKAVEEFLRGDNEAD